MDDCRIPDQGQEAGEQDDERQRHALGGGLGARPASASCLARIAADLAARLARTLAPSAPARVMDAASSVSSRGPGAVVAGILAALVLGILIVVGILTRVRAEAVLATTTRQDSVLSVAVTTPMEGAAAQEITLPANTQAFIDTPIYARTSGYLRKWYADIGTHVHSGQLLAEIDTPELDQQVRQAQSDLATAQSNQEIAQITAERWTKLLAKNAVSKQETDQAMSDFRGRQSPLGGPGERDAFAATAGF